MAGLRHRAQESGRQAAKTSSAYPRGVCRGDRRKFKYVFFWLAWLVQNPDKNPETVIVLKSVRQGTGKTTLNYAMSRIFGPHARTISDKDRLFDRFNADLETIVFVDADEMLWAGDRGTADRLKSIITSTAILKFESYQAALSRL